MENVTCGVTKNSIRGKILMECRLIVWDECTMANKKSVEALNQTLQDFRGNDKLMGGVVVLLSGDFRQTLPIIEKGTPADEIAACLKKSILWPQVKSYHLTVNMRSINTNDPQAQFFSDVLLQIGCALSPFDKNPIMLPISLGNFVPSLDALIEAVFLDLNTNYRDINWLCERAILVSTNLRADIINKKIMQFLPGNKITARSVDIVVEEDTVVCYPVEFLNSIQPSGMPPHILDLKKYTVVMLIRNLHPPKLCNGTRLLIDNVLINALGAYILTGCGKGEYTYIPRIPIYSTNLPFEFKRTQFPVQISYAMTINKSQGQSMEVVGIDLEESCFSHGQLYVAISRVGRSSNLYIHTNNNNRLTKNVVYREVLN